jgi:ribonuclease P protein component
LSGPSRGFPRSARLLTAGEFRRVFEDAERSADDCFTVLARRNAASPGRLGLAIAKKHLRRAVDRNLVKRLIRETFRLVRADLVGYDVVVLARAGAARRSRRQLRESLQAHWQRLLAAHRE